ncbi:MAG TPA: dTDP-4-dehydrorhamnose 3,5-epimerase [Phenylobacterium sp.]|nr:dTDP-4-dehydrorhamnose 3,5-epimerase [Phenylobacterium sp.]
MLDVKPLAIPEVLLITPARHGDARGWFAETWNRKAYAAAGVTNDFLQDNQAYNARAGTLRGIHFQRSPHAQAKLVRVLKGAILDVAVDLRAGSASFGRWVAAELTAERGEQLLVPRGFGHAYQTLTDDCELTYKVDGDYAPELEGGVIWNDPDLAIAWPLAPSVLSPRDQTLPMLKDVEAL